MTKIVSTSTKTIPHVFVDLLSHWNGFSHCYIIPCYHLALPGGLAINLWINSFPFHHFILCPLASDCFCFINYIWIYLSWINHQKATSGFLKIQMWVRYQRHSFCMFSYALARVHRTVISFYTPSYYIALKLYKLINSL